MLFEKFTGVFSSKLVSGNAKFEKAFCLALYRIQVYLPLLLGLDSYVFKPKQYC